MPGSAPALSRTAIMSLRFVNTGLSTLGIDAARRIQSIIRPRGSKAGVKRTGVMRSQGPFPIHTVLDNRPKPQHREIRNSVLVKIDRISCQDEKLRLNVGLWNARSLNGKVAALTSSILSNNLDFYVITETWAKTDADPIVGEVHCNLSAFSFYHRPRTARKGGGAAIVARSELQLKMNSVRDFASFEYLDACLRSKDQLIQCLAIYRPPYSKKNRHSTNDFISEFSSLLEEVLVRPGRLLILSDMNFHMDNPNCPEANKVKDLLDSLGLQQHVRGATHAKGHTLDLVITRASDDMIARIDVSRLLPSDHAEIIVGLNLRKPRPVQRTVEKRSLSKLDVEAFKLLLEPLSHLDSESMESLLDTYCDTVMGALDSLAPLKKKIVTDRPRAQWYTPDLAEARAALRVLEKKWYRTKLEIDRQIFTRRRDEYHRLLDDAKCTYHRDRIQDADSKQLFRIVDDMIGKGCNVRSSGPSGIPADKVPDAFGQFFVDKVENFRSRFESSDKEDGVCFSGVEFSEFQLVSEAQVRKVVMTSPTKSCSLDVLPTHLLKNCIDVVLPFITNLINTSFRTGCLPDVLKQAILTPLLKKPGLDADVLGNYRPVSNTPFFMKTIERIACPQIHQHLSANALYTKCQSAYRANYSTETALLRVQNDICCALDRREYAVLVMLDLSAAFDTVDHKILLRRLQYRFGVTGLALAWFKSYLDSREQTIVFNGHSSSHPFDVKYGVPQGSVLGPLLFTLYSAPVADIIMKHELDFMIYSDDTQLYLTCRVTSEARTRIESCVSDIKDWMNDNYLVLNDNKTELMVFESIFKGQKDTEVVVDNIVIGDAEVQGSRSVRNLGVIFDRHLSMDIQIKSLCQKAAYGLYKIGRIRRLLDQRSTEMLVHALITSKMDYCNSTLLGCHQDRIHKLQLLQNSAARIVSRCSKYDHITPILQRLHWLPVDSRIRFKVLLMVFKVIHGLAPDYLCCLVRVYQPGRAGLRSGKRSVRLDPEFLPIPNTKFYGGRAFALQAPVLWNELPDSVRSAESVSIFKSRLKTHLFRLCF